MIDQELDHYTAVKEFQGAQPFGALGFTFSGNAGKKATERRWEASILSILNGLDLYARLYQHTYGDTIGSDIVMREAIEDTLDNIRMLLNGEKGRLDGGLMMKSLREFAIKNDLRFQE